eukprot:TRINITY_DN6134_c2_g1_i1.p1 TRINITY_DN6134_c2_g1~~TRINITY_DN6134_c2_g1_i1.p1  ORF type:complete len:982 (+),score=306.81 TRINITY_DN6134_c2_g1_i1:90-2948(+)
MQTDTRRRSGRVRTRAAAKRWRMQCAQHAQGAAVIVPVGASVQAATAAALGVAAAASEELLQPRGGAQAAVAASLCTAVTHVQRRASRVPHLSVCVLGGAGHGKSALVQLLAGRGGDRGRQDRVARSTGKLGYADASVYRSVQGPRCWFMPGLCGEREVRCAVTGELGSLAMHVSFLDCPGSVRQSRAAVSGAAAAAAAVVVAPATEPFPQPQAEEHLRVAAAAGIDASSTIVVQTKVDISGGAAAQEHSKQVMSAVPGAAVVPSTLSHPAASSSIIAEKIAALPAPSPDLSGAATMHVVRSFDTDRSGAGAAVVGGSIARGVLRVGDRVELSPGSRQGDEWEPHTGIVRCLRVGGVECSEAYPGGLVGVEIEGVPGSLAGADGLVGQTLGAAGTLPKPVSCISLRQVQWLAPDAQDSLSGAACVVVAGARTAAATVVDSGSGLTLDLGDGAVTVAADEAVSIAVAEGSTLRTVCVGWAEAASAVQYSTSASGLLSIPFGQVWRTYPRLRSVTKSKAALRDRWGTGAPGTLVSAIDRFIRDGVFDPPSPRAPAPPPRRPASSGIAIDPSKDAEPGCRERMPAVCVSGRRRTTIENFDAIAAALRRPVDLLVRAVSGELGVVKRGHGGRHVAAGRLRQADVQVAVYGFVRACVLCRRCGSPRTELAGCRVSCGACGAAVLLDAAFLDRAELRQVAAAAAVAIAAVAGSRPAPIRWPCVTVWADDTGSSDAQTTPRSSDAPTTPCRSPPTSPTRDRTPPASPDAVAAAYVSDLQVLLRPARGAPPTAAAAAAPTRDAGSVVRKNVTVATRFRAVAKSLGRGEEALRAHLEAFLQARVTVSGRGHASIARPAGRASSFAPAEVDRAVADFVARYVRCGGCGGEDTECVGGRVVCKACAASQPIGPPLRSWAAVEADRRRSAHILARSRAARGAAAVPQPAPPAHPPAVVMSQGRA